MQVAERRNFMDIFYINCFSHSLYLSREKYFMFLVFLDYHLRYIYAEIEYIWGEKAK